MDKQLLEQEALVHYPKIKIEECAGPIDFDKRNVQNQQLRWAYIAGATSSSTVKNLEREVDRLKALAFKEFESKISLWGLTRAQYDREVEVFKERNNL